MEIVINLYIVFYFVIISLKNQNILQFKIALTLDEKFYLIFVNGIGLAKNMASRHKQVKQCYYF